MNQWVKWRCDVTDRLCHWQHLMTHALANAEVEAFEVLKFNETIRCISDPELLNKK